MPAPPHRLPGARGLSVNVLGGAAGRVARVPGPLGAPVTCVSAVAVMMAACTQAAAVARLGPPGGVSPRPPAAQ